MHAEDGHCTGHSLHDSQLKVACLPTGLLVEECLAVQLQAELQRDGPTGAVRAPHDSTVEGAAEGEAA